MLECVINVSEGRDADRIQRIGAAAGDHLLDVHSDPDHHRSVLTLVGVEAARGVALAAVEEIDLRAHAGVHPRLGAVDVVPFVALSGSSTADALAARDDFGVWFAATAGVPGFRYGPERTLPDVRRTAFRGLDPDFGGPEPHPTAGATAVGQRPVLVAYNVWVAGVDDAGVRALAGAVRSPGIRTLGLAVGERWQVSMNLVDPSAVGPEVAYDRVVDAARGCGAIVEGAELVGLVPDAVLARIPRSRWEELDVAENRTIEARLEMRGLS